MDSLELLENLYIKYGQDFYVFYLSSIGKWHKWILYSEYKKAINNKTIFPYSQIPNQRQILKNEIVIELDSETQEKNKAYCDEICQQLDNHKQKYYAYWSGNKSYHIHLFMDDLRGIQGGLFLKKIKELFVLENFKDLVDSKVIDMGIFGEKHLIQIEYSKHRKTNNIKEKYLESSWSYSRVYHQIITRAKKEYNREQKYLEIINSKQNFPLKGLNDNILIANSTLLVDNSLNNKRLIHNKEDVNFNCNFLNYCITNKLPTGYRNNVVSKNITVYVKNLDNKNKLLEIYAINNKINSSEIKGWDKKVQSGQIKTVSCIELKNYQKQLIQKGINIPLSARCIECVYKPQYNYINKKKERLVK